MLGSARPFTLSYFRSISTYVITVPERHRHRDRQTDGLTTYCGITALCVASGGKNLCWRFPTSSMTLTYCLLTMKQNIAPGSTCIYEIWNNIWFKNIVLDRTYKGLGLISFMSSCRRRAQVWKSLKGTGWIRKWCRKGKCLMRLPLKLTEYSGWKRCITATARKLVKIFGDWWE